MTLRDKYIFVWRSNTTIGAFLPVLDAWFLKTINLLVTTPNNAPCTVQVLQGQIYKKWEIICSKTRKDHKISGVGSRYSTCQTADDSSTWILHGSRSSFCFKIGSNQPVSSTVWGKATKPGVWTEPGPTAPGIVVPCIIRTELIELKARPNFYCINSKAALEPTKYAYLRWEFKWWKAGLTWNWGIWRKAWQTEG